MEFYDMTAELTETTALQRQPARAGFFRGLSGKLLFLTVIFVMLAEVLIFVPSVANMRIRWMEDRLNTAAAAGVVVDGLQDVQLSRPLHFGDYGGLPLKIIWVLLDLVTIFLLGSGLYLWLTRRALSGDADAELMASRAAAKSARGAE